MSVKRVASRYAKSLIDLAIEQKVLERVMEDVTAFQEATKNRDFHLLVKSPIVKADKKKSIFKALFENKFEELSLSFLNLILVKGREEHLPDICQEFMEQYREIKEISIVRLITAAPFSDSSIQAIRKKLESSGVTRKNVKIEPEIDPSLIGGFILEFEDKLYDASVKYKLEQLKKDVRSSVAIN